MAIALYIGIGLFASVGVIWLVAPQIFVQVDPTKLRKGSREEAQYLKTMRTGKIFGIFTLVLSAALVVAVAWSGIGE